MIEVQLEQKDIDVIRHLASDLQVMLKWEGAVLQHWTDMHQIAYDDTVREVQGQTAPFSSHLAEGWTLIDRLEQAIELGEKEGG